MPLPCSGFNPRERNNASFVCKTKDVGFFQLVLFLFFTNPVKSLVVLFIEHLPTHRITMAFCESQDYFLHSLIFPSTEIPESEMSCFKTPSILQPSWMYSLAFSSTRRRDFSCVGAPLNLAPWNMMRLRMV